MKIAAIHCLLSVVLKPKNSFMEPKFYNRILTCVLALLLLSGGAQSRAAQTKDNSASAKASSPAEAYRAMVQEYDAAVQEFTKNYQQAKTDDERQKAMEKYPQADSFTGRFLTFAQNHPKDAAAVDALAWIVQNARNPQNTDAEKALKVLLNDHVANPKLGPVCQSLAYAYSSNAEKFLRAVLARNPDHQVQGHAAFNLAQFLHRRGSPDAFAEAEKYFEHVVGKFGDVPGYRGTLGDAAKSALFEVRNLAVGMVAPDIQGEDVDGKAFKLSDYRGKVVVIDFWGDW